MSEKKKIAIIGYGIGGKLLAYKLSKLGYVDITDSKFIDKYRHLL
jgi:glycine/D-amino acid oxidase-like deaminating enzyme